MKAPETNWGDVIQFQISAKYLKYSEETDYIYIQPLSLVIYIYIYHVIISCLVDLTCFSHLANDFFLNKQSFDKHI